MKNADRARPLNFGNRDKEKGNAAEAANAAIP